MKTGWLKFFVLSSILLVVIIQSAPATGYMQPPTVAAYTSGAISRASKIQIVFTENVVTLEKIGQEVEKSPFTFEPEIDGAAVWTSASTLVFIPKEKLSPGQAYNATLHLNDIMAVEPPLDPFFFEFTVIQQAFDINIDGLQAVHQADLKLLKLTGKVTTADTEEDEHFQHFLSARQNDKPLDIQWTHSNNKREHAFVVNGIIRGQGWSSVILQWDGSHIGVEQSDDRWISVPPSKGPFAVLQVKAVNRDEQYIEVRFNDPVKKDQDLNGLIDVAGTTGLRFALEDNIVRVYNPVRWQARVQLTVRPGIRSDFEYRLENEMSTAVDFSEILPQVRFVGKGVILPTTQGLTIPVETMNLTHVLVEAMQLYETNIPQFLQVNALDGNQELTRVGKVVWRKVVDLGFTPEQKNQWIRHGLDLTPLVQNNPGGMYQLTLSFKRQHIVYSCPESEETLENTMYELAQETGDWNLENSYWDAYQDSEEFDWDDWYDNRENPCHPSFYRERYYYSDHTVSASRNILVSDIGLIAKTGGDKQIIVAATDLKTTKPLAGIEVAVMDYQQQIQSMAKTDADGMALLRCEEPPFLIVAKRGEQRGYLKLEDGAALSVSHFDVRGQTIQKGLNGFLYGERGVWRPGDTMYLTFILFDSLRQLPKEHPVIFELLNPKGQLVKVLRKKEGLNGFYPFEVATEPDAPTGNWLARVRVGGATFEKVLKVATVMPNRLKLKLDFGDQQQIGAGESVTGTLAAAWLHGAIAKYLDADIELMLSQARTYFAEYPEYTFDDPTRQYEPESQRIFEGTLDENGNAAFSANINAENVSPGMLSANFTTRVFEPSGAFSIDQFSLPYHPYNQYVGLRLPKGDKRGMLLTDTQHTARFVLLDRQAQPVPSGQVEVKLYKVQWRWWWEEGANYAEAPSFEPLSQGVVDIHNGEGEWSFQIKYPEWGRYLVRACDLNGAHCTGKTVYIDWPGWAGRASKDIPGGATVLSFAADKDRYVVGEKIVLTIPTGKEGRGLVSIESGSKVVHTAWIEPSGAETTQYEFTATHEMTPNVYAHVTLLQPHLQTQNDLPIRMYGVIPLLVEDPATRLSPQLETPEQFMPETTAEIKVSEASGRPMTYTVAIVDEGLLDLTRFITPDPWKHFYQRVALGVKTWDVYDFVAGAYSGVLDKLLAIGGDDALRGKGRKNANRFPPMVRFMGPFTLEAGAANTHTVDIPQYVGSVRVMVVAAQDDAFGSAEKAVFVRKPLMILGTLPRVLGVQETVEMPVSVFAMDPTVKDVAVTVAVNGPVSIIGDAEKRLSFSDPGDDLITFILKTPLETGIANVKINAVSGSERITQTIEIDVRMPGEAMVDVYGEQLAPQETWQQNLTLPGIKGTNEVTLELSRIPPLNLDKRLKFLIRYPYGCVEQTTSSVFPQLYLDKLLELTPARQDDIQRNVQAGITRLQQFQTTEGGFAYWPGENKGDDWTSSYVGHFLIEARNAGYALPPNILEHWSAYQRTQAQQWQSQADQGQSELKQAYRLYTLALAGAPELGAMNRLREIGNLANPARWRLAAAYLIAGQPEAAQQLILKATTTVPEYRELAGTYGSSLRDKAMILEALTLLKQVEPAKQVAQEIASALNARDRWLSTQETACALIAMARYAGVTDQQSTDPGQFSFTWNAEPPQTLRLSAPILQIPLTALEVADQEAQAGKEEETSEDETETGIEDVEPEMPVNTLEVINTGAVMVFPRLIVSGVPRPGTETAAENGLSLAVQYFDRDGEALDPSIVECLEQGTDFSVQVTVTNTGYAGTYQELALTQIFPSGWEIRNMRLDPSDQKGTPVRSGAEYNYQDIRDDRVYTYFDLKQGESKTFTVKLNASYLGEFYLPMITVEAMYDAIINARVPGRWILVLQPGEIQG
ncbi:alpha-2-macroglobulin domain protein [Candidatus Vecturithrix granuli]|uniref:Alpha-2-macroglobulin domain protein n=1 Tax=Vecturithrix granuli TaxID=1499967 RepID=A0A081BUT1_VECG1|nr:alpha-2-macroglobulin domain protein [Candidatus Vecturithrix granuli]